MVNENYITRYDPLEDHTGKRIGILYVGAKQASFYTLVNTFNQRIVLVALGMMLFTFILTTPVSRVITRPLEQIRGLVVANRRVAEGDMSVRVSTQAGGEIGELTSSFNSMLDTLQTTQDQLVQSEKLASLGQLAAGVAHELNNPLGTILLYSDILLKEAPPDSQMKADLEVIVEETKRCKTIVASLLEFARQNQVVARPTDLNALILSVIDVELKRYEGKPVEIVSELAEDLPKIQADHAQIMQVLVNLIENAVDAMPQGGRVVVRTLKEPPAMVTIEIEDNGTGIPPEDLKKLFTPFFTTKPIGKGTGLGLPIVYGIVKMHRGQIMVRSEVNQGTRFVIQLPVKLLGIDNQQGNNEQNWEVDNLPQSLQRNFTGGVIPAEIWRRQRRVNSPQRQHRLSHRMKKRIIMRWGEIGNINEVTEAVIGAAIEVHKAWDLDCWNLPTRSACAGSLSYAG